MVRLRAHHLLCLHGFRGLGYNSDFAANMQKIHRRLKESPQTVVEVLNSADDICAACPNLSHGRCSKDADGGVTSIVEKDSAVIERLALAPGASLPAGELFSRTADAFGSGIGDLCSSCSWMPLGWCEAGLKNRTMSE